MKSMHEQTPARTGSLTGAVIFYLVLGVVLLLGAGNARADTCSATMSDVNFGNVSPLSSSDIVVSASGTVTCAWTLLSLTPPYLVLLPNVSVCVNFGTGDGSVSGAPRTLSNSTAKLEYNLYRDPSLTAAAIAGSTTLPSASIPLLSVLNVPNLLLGGSITQNFTIWGRIPAGAALAGVSTSGNGDTSYLSSFAGHATINYAFYNLIKPACTSGQSGSFAFTVRAKIINDCKINAAPLSFGTVGSLRTAVRASTVVSVQCVNNNAFQIALSGGTAGLNVGARKMKSAAGNTISYTLSSVLDGPSWGDGTLGTGIFSGLGDGIVRSVPIFGMVPVQPTPAPGDYRDTVTATVVF